MGGLGGITVVLKSRALGVTVKPFIDAARVAGGSDFHLIVKHVIPNVLPLSFLYMMFTVTSAIFAEASLSFFGLLPNVRMSLGLMINERTRPAIWAGRSWRAIGTCGCRLALRSHCCVRPST